VYDLVARYLARAFVRTEHVSTSSQGYAQLAERLGEPTWLPRHVAEIVTGGRVVQRLSIASPSNEWALQIVGESVDLQYTPTPGTQPIDLGRFAERARAYLSAGLSFVGGPAHRLALVQEGILPQLTQDGLSAVRSRLLNLPESFAVPFEWDWRVAMAVGRSFGGLEEQTNVVITAKRGEIVLYTGSHLDRIFVSLDLNTSPRRTEPRFGVDQIAAFLSGAPNWHREVSETVLDFAGLR
jgi:hypothetical protein